MERSIDNALLILYSFFARYKSSHYMLCKKGVYVIIVKMGRIIEERGEDNEDLDC